VERGEAGLACGRSLSRVPRHRRFCPLPLSCVRLLGGALATAGEDKNFKVWSLLGGASPVLIATLSQGDAKLNNGIALAATGRIACACATTGSGGLVIWEPKVVAF
jgi:hypothetical protein